VIGQHGTGYWGRRKAFLSFDVPPAAIQKFSQRLNSLGELTDFVEVLRLLKRQQSLKRWCHAEN